MAKITIDPGHGGTENVGGSSWNNASGPNGTLEKDLTLDVGLRLRSALTADDHEVTMTRDNDTNIGLSARASVARTSDADMFVSIHFNGWDDPDTQGTETFIYPDSGDNNTRFASLLQGRLVACTGYRDRGVKTARFGVIRSDRHLAKTVACLVEVSFMTDPSDEARLESETYRSEIAAALAAGIGDYVSAPSGLVADPARLYTPEAFEVPVEDGDA